MRLNQWQQEIEAYLLGADSLANDELRASLVGSPNLDVDLGLAIYHNAYRARLIETLRGDYQAVHGWMGDEEFDALALAYINAYPPDHFSLRWLGARFAEFIEAHLVPEQAEPLAELVRFEWAFTLSFDAPDGEPLTEAVLASLQADEWPNLQARFLPSVQWQTLRYNTMALWRAIKEDTEFPGSHRLEQESVCLIWRAGLISRYRTLGPDEASALYKMAVQGGSFAELCTDLVPLGDNAMAQAITWIRQWLADGTLQRHMGEPVIYQVDSITSQ